MASRVVRRNRRILRQLPDAMRTEIIDALDKGGVAMAAAIKSRTPRRTGALRGGIRYKVYPRTLKLRIGLVGPRRQWAALFYGWILNFGRKSQTVKARRAGGKPYQLRVRALAAKQFVTGQLPNLRAVMNRQLNNIWDRALARVAGGKNE